MATVTKFEELDVWQKARLLENKVFELTTSGKLSRDFSLKDQINRSSGSVMDNIAEGFGRGSKNEFVQFLSIARGSLAEVQSQLHRCLDREYISQEISDTHYLLAEEVAKMLTAFIHYLNKSDIRGDKFKNRNTASPNSKL